MNAHLAMPDELHAQLLGLCHAPPLADYLCITARREHGVKAVRIERPTLGIVLQGHKRLGRDAQAVTVAAGDVFLVTRRCQLDAVNSPDPLSGQYLTLAVPLCDTVLDAARLLWAQVAPVAGPEVLRFEAHRVRAQLTDWCCALHAGRLGAARLALTSLLLRLCEWGHSAILVQPPATVAAQLHHMIEGEPDRAWRAMDFELALGVSGATLRRRLAQEGTTVSAVVADARLAHALSLLYTTHWPLKTVAARVGYRSVPSFSRRFAERFGIEPGAIGNVSAARRNLSA